jgi:hypothetical protein
VRLLIEPDRGAASRILGGAPLFAPTALASRPYSPLFAPIPYSVQTWCIYAPIRPCLSGVLGVVYWEWCTGSGVLGVVYWEWCTGSASLVKY